MDHLHKDRTFHHQRQHAALFLHHDAHLRPRLYAIHPPLYPEVLPVVLRAARVRQHRLPRRRHEHPARRNVRIDLHGSADPLRQAESVSPLCFVALSLHLSMILPIVTFVLTRYYAKPKRYILIWCFFLVLSMLNATEFMQDYVSEASSITDSRLSEYIRHEDEIVEIYTNAGFRPDFVLYSLFPILCGAFLHLPRHGLLRPVLHGIFCMYIATNCFLRNYCVISVPFGDRFALLGWIFAPFIVLYPLLPATRCSAEQTKWGLRHYVPAADRPVMPGRIPGCD